MEERRNIDINLIKNATSKQPTSFTGLLHITKLPRKTLALRLKDMCEEKILVKENGLYKLNGASSFYDNSNTSKGFASILKDKRFRTGLMLIVFLIGSSASGYALARFFTTTEISSGPQVLGEFRMTIEVNGVTDLYTWQVLMTFNSSELVVTNAYPGRFFEIDYPFFLNATDIGEGKLLLGGTLSGDIPGESGSGTLATVVFGYLTPEYKEPEISFNEKGFFQTLLIDSTRADIPNKESKITLTLLP
ncbi:MAG: cohesin domain-containing protein [Candidatus Bathyarchaeota archaeon]|jgi:hypothetical protein